MESNIFSCFREFLSSQSNIGHFNREKDWEKVKKKELKEIFENQSFIRDEIVNYISYYYPEFLNRKFTVLDVGCSLVSLSFAFREIADFVLGIDI